MRLVRSALNAVLSQQFQSPRVARAFSASASPLGDEWDKLNSSMFFGESAQGNFGDQNASKGSSVYERLGLADRAVDRYRMGGDIGEDHHIFSDGVEHKLKQAAAYFDFDPLEVVRDDYSFRPDVNFQSGMTYETKDLDLRNSAARKPFKRMEFETTTAEVLQEADFRNVRFLAKFITDAGIIQKRSKTGISAKAQRKLAREIKTARAFGLMPFTTMGTKQFRYGDTMEDMDRDFEFEPSHEYNFVEDPVDA